MADKDARDPTEPTLLQPESAPSGRATPENVQRDAASIGEASGGLGAVGGMSVGAIAGPVGLVLGGIAGAVGGWWAGHGIAGALTAEDEAYFRAHHEREPGREGAREGGRDYDATRPAYVAGYLAGRNPDYAGRAFDDVESDLRCGWSDDVAARCGDWPAARDRARAGFDRARAS